MFNFWQKISQSESDKISLTSIINKHCSDNLSEEEKIEIACIAGMIAEVIHSDGVVDDKEKEFLLNHLKTLNLTDSVNTALVLLILNHVNELAGLEQHYYYNEMKDLWDRPKKVSFLALLFQLAAIDGSVDSTEVEKIRVISDGLALEHQEFINCKLQVKSKLKILK